MKKFINEPALSLFVAMSLHYRGLTKKDKLQSLLNKLQPVSCDKELIRLGAIGDGGYLVPDDLAGIEACFSPGVGFDSVFEKDCANRGMKVFLADGSLDQPSLSHELFVFTKKHIGIKTNDNFMNIDDWVKSSWPDSQGDLLLQMDIEGSEYEVLLIASDDLLKRFRIIVVEFHSLNELWSKPFFNMASLVFERLLQTHTCVHNHPNNCSDSVKFEDIELPMVTELTFLRNDRISSSSFAKIFPHPLDIDNTKDKPSLPLPKCWYNEK
ncbi:MAG: hypothetical protein CVU62_01345 [Deltaproteobacteria bacterium HGW-Deltaproteobacteria-2]|jgi:hypothetical protein|nr:MAG: hypothetical protein CVU62_01345 [Deltaproteobacteria bacterium HGW-Deltaproteobacteria-2]